MRIFSGQFNDSYFPVIDGVVNVTKNYALHLERLHGNCVIAAPDYPEADKADNDRIIRCTSFAIPGKPPYRYALPFSDYNFRKAIQSLKFDILHAHSPFSIGKYALWLSGKKGIPIVATFHSKYYDDILQETGIEKVARIWTNRIVKFYNKTDQVWTVNEASKKTLMEYGYKGSIEVVRNAVDTEFLEEASVLSNNKRKSPVPVFLFVGQLVWQKNLKMLLDALSIVKSKGHSFKLIVIGKGNAELQIKDYAAKLNLSGNIVYKGSVKDRKKLAYLYSQADLFLFPSVYDNAPLVVMEAAALKCPSLVISGSNASEGIYNNINGFLSKNHPLSYSETIIDIMYNSNLLIEAGVHASETLCRSWDNVMDEVSLRYCELIKSKTGTALKC